MPMDKDQLPTDAPDLGDSHLPVDFRKHESDVVKVAHYILAHSQDISRETAHSLLVSASKKKKK